MLAHYAPTGPSYTYQRSVNGDQRRVSGPVPEEASDSVVLYQNAHLQHTELQFMPDGPEL
jgi:hypothetical protein